MIAMEDDQNPLMNGHALAAIKIMKKEGGTVNSSAEENPQALVLEAIQRFKQNRKRTLNTISMTYDGEDDDEEEEEEKGEDALVEDNDKQSAGDSEIKAKGAVKSQRLNEAVLSGNYSNVMRLLEQKIDVNIPDVFGRTPLQNAILKGDARIVDTLLVKKADVSHQDDRGDTPLHFAARSGNTKILQLLLGYQATLKELNTEGSNKYTPLHIAANLNKPDLCQILLSYNADFDSREDSGKTPLGKAMESGAAKSAKFLLEYVNQNQLDLHTYLSDADHEGNTLLHLAVDSGFTEVVELCLEYGAQIRQPKRNDRSTAFHLACEQGATEIVELFLQRDPSLGKILLVDNKGTTPLHKAARSNNATILTLLIDQGANVNARNNKNVTPLMMAASAGATESVRLLMGKGADTTIKDIDGRTAVYNAVGYANTMQVLLEDHALVPLLTEKDASGYAPPHYAAQQGDIKSIKMFLDHNKSTATILSDTQDTPLHVAARYGWHEIARALLEKQGSKIVNLQDNRSRTALHFACRGGYHQVARVLLDFGATVEKDQSNRTPLHEAAKKGSKRAAELMVNYHPHCLNFLDDEKNTALHIAATNSHAHLVTFFLSVSEQEILMNSSNQNVLDLSMDQDLRDVALAIAGHDRWREVLESCNAGVARHMIRLVKKMPSVAERIFDQCVLAEGDSTNPDYKVTYDMTIALPRSSTQKGTLQIMQIIGEERAEGLLRHPLTFTILSQKWNTFGYVAFLLNLVLFMMYLMPLTYLHVHLKENDQIFCEPFMNSTFYNIESNRWCLKKFTSTQALQILIASIAILLFLKEMVQCAKDFKAYIRSPVNWIELFSYGTGVYSVLPPCECKWGTQKTLAAIASFFGWISLILYIQRLPAYGKYIIMLYKMFVTLVKVLLIFLLFALAFGNSFFLLMYNDDFKTLPSTVVELFVMTLGELNYSDKFRPWSDLFYPYVLNILFFLFALTMPIILMNMLVGLSVGDIDGILQSAVLDRYCMQIKLLDELESSLPRFILRRVLTFKHVDYPNMNVKLHKWIFNSVIGFGDFEEPGNNEGEETTTAIATLANKQDEHSTEIEEMHALLRQMFQMMKDDQEDKERKSKSATLSH